MPVICGFSWRAYFTGDYIGASLTRGLRGVGCLDIHGVGIRVDAAGRYCLNDLHRSAGGQAKDQPAFFMRRRETADLVAELSNTENSRVSPELGASAISQTPVATLNNGSNNGTYVVKELVYAYAMWISASFHLKVIRAYDAMVAVQPAPGFAISQTLSEALRRRGHIVASISQFGRDRDNAI